jgi:hypothetical protein
MLGRSLPRVIPMLSVPLTRATAATRGLSVGIVGRKLVAVLAVSLTAIPISNAVTPSLCLHVAHVVELRAREEMIGSNTRRIVAVVQNPNTTSNRSIGQFVGNSVSVVRHPAKAELPVTIPLLKHTRSPHPATCSERGVNRTFFIHL